ncbi:MAG: M48 family metallopeptidase [Ignavibacteria bacterium]
MLHFQKEIPIEKIVYTRRKSIALHITENATLVIRAPYFTPQSIIKDVVGRHYKWIVKKRNEILKLKSYRPLAKFIDGEKYLYLGKYFELEIINTQSNKLVFNGKFFLSKSLLSRARKMFIQWYIDRAQEIIPKRLSELASENNFQYYKVRITRAEKRWGSCSSKGNLNFSWRLVMASPKVIDYVIIHELVHLEIKNHSKKFWTKVKSLMPEYKQQQQWLKTNQYEMLL